MQDRDHRAQEMSRRVRLSSREIAVALVLTIAAGAFLFATLFDGSRAGADRVIAASKVASQKK